MIIQTSKFDVKVNEKTYTVKGIEDIKITIDKQIVEKIEQTTGESEESIIELLATIEQTRKITSCKAQKVRKIDKEVATESIIKILRECAIENVILIIEGLKYFQIAEILESENPVESLRENM